MEPSLPVGSYEDFIVSDFSAYGLLPPSIQQQMFPQQVMPAPGHDYLSTLTSFVPSVPTPASLPHTAKPTQPAINPSMVRSPPESERPDKRRKTSNVAVNADPEKILEKNRESARESRRRKKEYIKSLEEKVSKLQTELHELRQCFEVYSQQAFFETLETKMNELDEMLKRPPQKQNDAELNESITTIQTLHTDQLQRTLGHHLERTEQMMQPFSFAKFILWGLDHDDAWFEADRLSGEGLWSAIIQELGITDEQQMQLFLLRPQSIKLKEEFLRLEKAAATMKRDTKIQLSSLDDFLAQLRLVLTPTQQAKFFVWSQRNKGCMQLVHSLWVTSTNK